MRGRSQDRADAVRGALSWGIVSDRDLVRALDASDTGVTAGALAVTAMLTVESLEPLDRAVQLIAAYDVTHVIVVDKGYLIGIVSALDVVRATARV